MTAEFVFQTIYAAFGFSYVLYGVVGIYRKKIRVGDGDGGPLTQYDGRSAVWQGLSFIVFGVIIGAAPYFLGSP